MRLGPIKAHADGSFYLTVEGEIPTKKNKLRPRAKGSGGRAHMYDPETKAAMNAIETQARIQWGSRKPLRHPRMLVLFSVFNVNKDRDGMWTTVLDCLKKAGVITDDAVRDFNSQVVIAPARRVSTLREEKVLLVITETEAA